MPTGKTAEAYFLFPELGRVDPQAPRDERLAQLAELMTSRRQRPADADDRQPPVGPADGPRELCFPVDALASRPWSEDLLDYLAAHLSDHGYDLKQTLELIATSRSYGSQSVAWDPTAAGRGICVRRPGAEANDGRAIRRRDLADDGRRARRRRPKTTCLSKMMYYATERCGGAGRSFARRWSSRRC